MRKLTAERDAKEAELNVLLSKRPADLWMEDLVKFEAQYQITLVRACPCQCFDLSMRGALTMLISSIIVV